jgi:hypothetical protein
MVASKINWYFKFWRPKQHWCKLWAIYTIAGGGWDPIDLLYYTNVTSTSWVYRHINTPQLVNAASITSTTNTFLMVLRTLKQMTQYNKYYIWNLKLGIQSKLSMALLKTYQPWIIFESKYCIRKLISLCHIILFYANFQLCSIQMPLNAFAYLTWVVRITNARSSSCSNLAYMLKGMAPTSHVIMPISWKMWLEASLTSACLGTIGVCIANKLKAHPTLGLCVF